MGKYVSERDYTRWVLGVVTLGIVARLVAVVMVGDTLHFVDEGIYLDAARRLLAGAGFRPDYANFPAYPLLLAALAWPAPDQVLFVRAIQALITGVGALLVFALGRRLFGAAVGVAAVTVYALDPLLVVSSALLYPEAVAALVLTGVLLASLTAADQDRLPASAAAGFGLGALVQCRPVAFVLLPVLAVWIAWALTAPARRRILHVVALTACCLLALVPWTVRNLRLHGGVVPAATRGLADGQVPTGHIANRGLLGAVAGQVMHEPRRFVSHVLREFGNFWELYPTRLATDDPNDRASLHRGDPRLPVDASFNEVLRDRVSAISFGSELVLALVGVVLTWREKRVAMLLLFGVTLVYAFGFAIFVGKLRYRIVVLPCVALFAGVGAMELLSEAAASIRISRTRRA